MLHGESFENGIDPLERFEALEEWITGYPILLKKITGECLARLDASKVLRRPDDRHIGGPQSIGNTSSEWSFRTQHSQGCAKFLRKINDLLRLSNASRSVVFAER